MRSQSQTPALSGRVAIVTGGSRGIGLAISAALLDEGASVVVTGRDPSGLASAIESLSGGSPARAARVHATRLDLRDADAAAGAVEAAVDRFGELDILVNNAGIGLFANVADMDVAAWHDTIETNLSGVFFFCHAAIPRLRERGGGWIINVSSLASQSPFAGGAAYCASKAGLNAFSEALMQELRQDDIRVSVVMPGSVATGFGRARTEAGARNDDWKLAPEDVAQAVVDLLRYPARSLPSRIEIRPSKPLKR